MVPEDRAFLSDFMQFGCYSHCVALASLFEQFRRPGHISHKFNELGLSEGHISKICAAKIYSEFVSGLEDYTSFFDAVKRREHGIFAQYTNSSTNQGLDFSSCVQKSTSNTLRGILALPSLSKLRHKLNTDEYKMVRDTYKEIPKSFRRITKIYQPADYSGLEKNDTPKPKTDTIDVILGYTLHGNNPTFGNINIEKLPIMTKLHNKIKHRFLVVDDIKSIWNGIDDNSAFLYSEVPYSTRWMNVFMEYVQEMAQDISSLCQLILLLDKRNLLDSQV